MDVEKTILEKQVTVTNNGMISIPADIRKKHGIKDGDYLLVKDDEDGTIRIFPLESVETLRERALTVDKFREIYEASRKEDMGLER